MEPELHKIGRAIISVSDKTGIIDFAKFLADCDVEILSTGGTSKALKDAGIPLIEVADFTGFPEMFGGRVKTLHPKIHGGILQRRDNEEDYCKATDHNIPSIDLVVVNLYPFEETVAKSDVTLEKAIENIDIGGPSMLRSAAKNHRWVTVVTDPRDYAVVLEEMKNNSGVTTRETRQRLASNVFLRTSEYDSAIATYLCAQPGYGFR